MANIEDDAQETGEDAGEGKRGGAGKDEERVKRRKTHRGEESEYTDFSKTESPRIPAKKPATSRIMTTAVSDGSSSSRTNSRQPSVIRKQNLTRTAAAGSCTSANSHKPNSVSEELNQPPLAVKNPCFTINDIFRDLFVDLFKRAHCPLSPAQAVSGVLHKQLTLEKASLTYCTSPSWLQTCLSNVAKLQMMFKKHIEHKR